MLWVIIFFFLLFSFSVSMFFFPFPLSQLFLLFGGFPLYAPSCIADFKGAERVFIYLLLPGLVYVLLQVDFLLFYWGPAGQNDGTFWMYHRSSCLCTVHGLGRGGDKGVRGVGAIIMSDHVAIEIDGLLYCASHSPTRPPTRRSGRQVQRPLGALDRSPRSRRTERHGLHRVHTYIGRVKGASQGKAGQGPRYDDPPERNVSASSRWAETRSTDDPPPVHVRRGTREGEGRGRLHHMRLDIHSARPSAGVWRAHADGDAMGSERDGQKRNETKRMGPACGSTLATVDSTCILHMYIQYNTCNAHTRRPLLAVCTYMCIYLSGGTMRRREVIEWTGQRISFFFFFFSSFLLVRVI